MFKLIKTAFYLLISAAVIAFFSSLGGENTAFEDGEVYTFYCGSVSSNAEIVVCTGNAGAMKLTLSDVCGESVVYTDKSVRELEERYRAVLLFEETCGGVINRYYYSPYFTTAITVDGIKINLHIAQREGSVCIGTPIIFGGY